MFLVILDVQTPVQEIAVPQTAQLPVAQRQLAAVTYAQMHVRDANHYVKVLAKKGQHVELVVILSVIAAIMDVGGIVHQIVIEHVLLHHVSQRLVVVIVLAIAHLLVIVTVAQVIVQQHVTMQVAAQTVVILTVVHLVREADAHLIATIAAHIIAKVIVLFCVQTQIVKICARILIANQVARKIVREHVMEILVHMIALLNVIILALQEVVHVVIVAIESAHIAVRGTAQLIVNSHVLTQK